MGFNLIYWTPLCGKYFLDGSILEKRLFSGQLQPDWGNPTWAATAGLGKCCRSGYDQIGV